MPVIGVILVGPTNPYSAVMLVIAGLVATAAACAIATYRMIRPFAPDAVALPAGLVGAMPPLLPIFGTVRIELDGVLLYGLLLGSAALFVERSQAARAFAATWAVAAIGRLVLLAIER